VVLLCVEYLKKHALKERQLFRLSTSEDSVIQLKDAFDYGKTVNLTDSFITASTLMLYLQMLPYPLIPQSLHHSLMRLVQRHTANSINSNNNNSELILMQEIARQCRTIPARQRNLLAYLLDFLALLTRNDNYNNTASDYLAYFFAPYLFRPVAATTSGSDSSSSSFSPPSPSSPGYTSSWDRDAEAFVIKLMIEGFDTIFKDKTNTYLRRGV
jgi:hypothetical protein